MGAKFKSKTHLLNTFIDFWRCFLRVLLQSLKKVQQYKYDLKLFFNQMQNFMLISNSLKHFLKMHQKSYQQNKFDEHD
jgi:hypothetical protein